MALACVEDSWVLEGVHHKEEEALMGTGQDKVDHYKKRLWMADDDDDHGDQQELLE